MMLFNVDFRKLTMEGEKTELAYKRKQRKRGKNRKIRLEAIADKDNLWHAMADARKGKNNHKGVRIFDRNQQGNIDRLSEAISNRTYHTSEGTVCEQLCPCGKIRKLLKLPFYPDHIAQHAMMRQIMPSMTRYYYYDSSASIKGRGIHYAAKRVQRYVDENRHYGRLYYVKLDFVKFYHNISQELCYDALAKQYGNEGVRYMIREAITATDEGLGIGLYPIQPMANFYLCRMVRWIMARHKGVKIFVYCDDIPVIGHDKKEVWAAVNDLLWYAENVLHQPVHDNYGMQVIDEKHSLDFVGYRYFFGYTLLRTRMKRKFARTMARLKEPLRRYQIATSYKGWCMHGNGMNLWRKVMNMKSFSDLQLPEFAKHDKDGNKILDGQKISAAMLEEQRIEFSDISLFDSKKQPGKRSAWIQVKVLGKTCKFTTANQSLIDMLEYCKNNGMMPFEGELYNQSPGSGMPNYSIR